MNGLIPLARSVSAWMRSFWPVLVFGVLPAVVLLSIPTVDSLFGKGQTWVLSTKTRGASIEFKGQNNAWPLDGATLCTPRSKPLRQSLESKGSDNCDLRRYIETQPERLLVKWSEGSAIKLRATRDRLEIMISSPTDQLSAGSLILLPNERLTQFGALSFTGTAEIGSLMSTGANAYLLEGSFAVREIGLLSKIIRRRTVVVKQGELSRGDVVTVVSGSKPETMVNGFGHITFAEKDSEALNIVFLSSSQSAALKISALGQDRPALLEPDWLERAIANPFLVVIALFGSLVGNFVPIFESLRSGRKKHDGNPSLE